MLFSKEANNPINKCVNEQNRRLTIKNYKWPVVFEKVFIFNPKKNINSNFFEIPSFPSQNSCHQGNRGPVYIRAQLSMKIKDDLFLSKIQVIMAHVTWIQVVSIDMFPCGGGYMRLRLQNRESHRLKHLPNTFVCTLAGQQQQSMTISVQSGAS